LVTLYELAYPNKQAEVARHLGLIVSSGQPLVSIMITYDVNSMLQRWLRLIRSDGSNHNALAMWHSSAEYMVNCVRTKFEGQAHQRFDSVGTFIDGTFRLSAAGALGHDSSGRRGALGHVSTSRRRGRENNGRRQERGGAKSAVGGRGAGV
jgi:hypothetical protein